MTGIEQLKEIRTQKGFTQQQLADQTGITLRTIQRIEKGEVKPSLHSLNVLSRVLEVDFEVVDAIDSKKPNEINIQIKITDMNQLFNDLKMLFKNNWKILLVIFLVLLFLTNYTAIKAGFIDGWNNK
jgi:transcriptional regulator with XRE-family HTH domain